MDFQSFVDHVSMPCCVISVENAGEGSWGAIRIAAANQAYKNVMGGAYYDNMLYSALVPQDNKFEDFCYRAAILKQRMHAYVETRALNCWTDQTLIPLSSERDDVGYCQFIFEFTRGAEADRMASISIGVFEAVIKACIKLMGSSDFKAGVGDVLDLIMEESGANATRIMLVDHEKKTAVNFCERVLDEVWPQRDPDVITYELIRTWEAMIGVSNAVIVKNDQDMEELGEKNPAWGRSLRENNVRSLVLIPLRQEKNVIGYLYVVNFDTEKAVEVKELIELVSFFLGSEISNQLLMQKLEEVSLVDALTGIKNRRAMIQRVRALSEREPRPAYGIINIDLNGLKTLNDQAGHEAGDRLLIQAGEVLKKLFYHDDIFRTGGDEFVIITSGMDRETFQRKIQRLRADAEKSGVSFAVGSCWSDGTMDLTDAFRSADEMMYADKEAFYLRNPELKSRK